MMNQLKELFNNHLRVILFPVAVLMVIALNGCQSSSSQQSTEAPTVYPLTGVVLAVDKSQGLITVKHDAIPGKMDAMTMLFSPADPAALSKLHEGDKISADMSIEGNGAVLSDIKVIPETTAK